MQPDRPTHKKIFPLAMEATKIFFANTLQQTLKSTLFRMFYLSQPIAGLLLLTSQLFSGRVTFLPTKRPCGTLLSHAKLNDIAHRATCCGKTKHKFDPYTKLRRSDMLVGGENQS
jgi:hypothetical protein